MISPKVLQEMVMAWEGYDSSLTVVENYIELQIDMGLLDDAHIVLDKFQLKKDNI